MKLFGIQLRKPTFNEVTVAAVMATGLFQWNTIETYPVTPIADMMMKVTELPVVFE